jgi:outer membrane murein-binding lipoprotein Lpp
LINEFKLDSVTSSWQKIRAELTQLSTAFGITRPPAQAAADPPANAPTCTGAVGAERAKRLVEECIQVSPATHPPCNAQNSCELIISEIKRSCALLGQTAPSFCSEYQ